MCVCVCVCVRACIHIACMYFSGAQNTGPPKSQGYTRITWTPDYARFGMEDGLNHDTLQCMTMRVYDLCACTRANIKITLNGRPLPFRSLEHYASLFWGAPEAGTRWQDA